MHLLWNLQTQKKRACDCESFLISQPDYPEHDRLPTNLRSCPGKRGRRWRFRQSCPKKRPYRRGSRSPQNGLKRKLGAVLRKSLRRIFKRARHLLPQLRPCSKRQTFTPTFEHTTTSRARIKHSLPGPKSGLRLALLMCLHSITQTGGVRVPISAEMGGPNPTDHTRQHHVGKHAPGGTTEPANTAAHAGATTGFKRSFRRAQHRCTQHNQGYTTYQGKLVHGSQLGLHTAQETSQASARKRRPECRRRGGHTQRLKILSINVNSLGGFLWSEVKVFLGEEGLQYDFIFLQETHRSTSSVFQIDKWMAVGSATKRGEGVLTLVNPKYDASMVRYQEIVPGRVLRVKVCRDDSALETLNVYQHVWIHTDEPEQNVNRRQLLLDKCTASIQGMARRDTLIVAGDFNSEVQRVPRLIGHSLNSSEYHKALDPHALTRFVQHNELVVLNTWRLKDPCTNYTRTGNSQIDFIMVRILSADAGAKRVHKCTAPFGTWKEMTHQALIADIRVIRHFHLPRPLHLTKTNYAVKDLDRAYRVQDSTINALAHRVQHKLESIVASTADQVNRILLQTVAELYPPPSRGKTGHNHKRAVLRAFLKAWQEIITQPDGVGGSVISLPTRVYHLWQRRRDLLHSRLYDASGIIRTWKWIVLYMKAGRKSKQYHSQSQRATTLGHLQQAERAAQQHNSKRLFGIVKRMIPWKPRPQIMLRQPDGAPMSLLQEHKALVQHCQQLFAPEVDKPVRQGVALTMPVTAADWTSHLRRTPIGKAVPADSAPATAWKACSTVLAATLADISAQLQQISSDLPTGWRDPQLCFLPKPHKPPSTAAALRPIGLLRPDGKALAGYVKDLVLDQARPSLALTPQYAYLPARDVTDALARVGTCIQDIRHRLRALGGSRFTVRERKTAGVEVGEAGGCLLSVDLSQAFDRVSRTKLDRALSERRVDANLRSTIAAIHEDAAYQVRNHFHSTKITTTQGIRQGCRLAPALWAILSSQVLWDLTPEGSTPMQLPWTLFADDHLGHWTLQTLQDVQQMEDAILALFHTLEAYGLKVNPDKSHMVVQVKGSRLRKLVQSRTVLVKNQPHWRLQDGDKQHLIPICNVITYLGTKLSLREGTDPTLEFRLAEAAAKTSSLRKSIRSRKGLSRSHRVRIWRTCVVSSAMYGLMAIPFNGHMVTKLRAWFHRNLRAVVNMPAHLTKISNKELRTQFDLPDPIQMIEKQIVQKIKHLQANHGDAAIRGQGVLAHWQTLQQQLQQAAHSLTSATIVETTTTEQHACPTCGLYYPTKKALRQHQALRHGQIQADKVHIVYKPEQHSIDGMPQCRHCQMKLYNWQALKGHVMLNVCNWYRPSQPDKVENNSQKEPVIPDTQGIDTRAPVQQETADVAPPGHTEDERLSASNDADSGPLLQRQQVVQQLRTHEGIVTQANLHKQHLTQHCGFCQRWIAEPGMIKTHILRVHKEVASCINAELHAECAKFKYLLRRDQHCRWCDRKVHGTDRHCSQCPVLFQLVLARIRREADSASPQMDLPTEWPMPQPALQKSIAECLAEPMAEHEYALLKNMAQVAKTHCLICGEQVQDIQDWRRHIKTKHEAQRSLVDALGQSSTLLAARLIRPCLWCAVHFQKSAKEHRKKCLPLLQLSLRHDVIADASGARTATSGSVGTQLSSCRDADAGTPGECGKGANQSWTTKQVQEGSRQGNEQESTDQARPRTGSRGRILDGSRSVRRGDDQAHPSSLGPGSIQTRTATDVAGSGSLIRPFPRSGSPWSDRNVGSSQPSLAPTVRSRHGDRVTTGDTMGCSPSRVEDKTRQDRKRHQCSPDSRSGSLDYADSAPVDLHGMERGAKEGPTSQQRQPPARGRQKSGEPSSQIYRHGRRRASIPESETTQAGHTGRGSGDAPDTHHTPTGSGDLQRPGHLGEQLCREIDRPATASGTSQQECTGQRAGKTTALNDVRTPTRSKSPTDPPEGDKRSPLPKLVRPLKDVTQPDIFTFFAGKTAAANNSASTPAITFKSKQAQATKTLGHPVNGNGLKSLGTHPVDATSIITGSMRTPPPRKIIPTNQSISAQGKKNTGSLLSWRIKGSTPSEPSARALTLHNPHNLCYANAVIHMLHYTQSLEGRISGLGALCEAFAQATRSNSVTNIARDSAWSFMWHGWRRPTHQHDAAEFLQHLCQRTDCTALHGGWEARKHREGVYEILDEQFSCPHIRLHLDRPFQIQKAIDVWHKQECVHAFTNTPDSLILQVGRFLQTERGIRKTRQSFALQKTVRIPVFTDYSGTVRHMQYEICGGVLHVGKVVTAGHYQAFYFPSQNEDIWQSHLIHDDDSPAVQGTAATQQAICTNCYLLAYKRSFEV